MTGHQVVLGAGLEPGTLAAGVAGIAGDKVVLQEVCLLTDKAGAAGVRTT